MALRSREKILIVLAIIAGAIWAFDRFYYTPQNHKIKALYDETKAADLKLNEYLQYAKGVETVEAEIARLERDLKKLNKRVVKGEEFRLFLRHLARESDPLQMKIISLIPQEEKISLPEGNKGTLASQYKKVSIQMVLHSTYNKLGAYLKGIEELPFFVNVDSLQIEKNEEIQPLLKVIMGLSMYIIDESKGFKGSSGQGVGNF
jgi:Tfp pilus assembly protein PilO